MAFNPGVSKFWVAEAARQKIVRRRKQAKHSRNFPVQVPGNIIQDYQKLQQKNNWNIKKAQEISKATPQAVHEFYVRQILKD